VDLGATTPIDQIVVWNRIDGEFGKRLKNYKVRVLDAAAAPSSSAKAIQRLIKTPPSR
jgi:hypothetical protein